MNEFIRWGKFNLVGAMGMSVQLAALSFFNRMMAGHYLFASAVAIELTVLHNFMWHLHYTWRDRRDCGTRLRQLVRFHLSNGSTSMVGNLALMRLLVHGGHLPLLLSNFIAILCCSIANFFLGNNWAFSRVRKTDRFSKSKIAGPASIHNLTVALMLFLFTCATANAQTRLPPQTSTSTPPTLLPDAPKSQPTPTPPYHSDPSATYLYHVGAFCGVGASTSPAASKPTAGCGVGMTFVPLPVFIEVGIMGPQANRSYLSGYISLDSSIPLSRSSSTYLPMAIVGYSRLFETGHAIDSGLALALPRFSNHRDDIKSLRIELRDYWVFANPAQHNIMLRVGWMGEEAD